MDVAAALITVAGFFVLVEPLWWPAHKPTNVVKKGLIQNHKWLPVLEHAPHYADTLSGGKNPRSPNSGTECSASSPGRVNLQ
jgi:hypothetical protein